MSETEQGGQPAPSNTNGDNGKIVAVVSYLTLIGFVIAVVLHSQKKTPLGAFHLSQTLGLLLAGLALGFVCIIPVLGWLVAIVGSLFLFVCWILGLIAAIGGEQKPFPLIGKFIQEKLGGVFR
ncbi:MAG: hypothetical protein LBR12_05830 [Opitutaceae bacterium]|jgi:uncharacterized membrane protein|nr:hypothetical protein [Opitutaceae bacterium]